MYPAAKRRKYDASFKLKAIAFAKSNNNCAAAREYGVTEKMVRDWRSKEDMINGMPKTKCANRSGTAYWTTLENYVAEMVLERRQNGYIVTRNEIRICAIRWAKDNPDNSKDFKATSSWCSRFMERKGLVLRQKTKIAQKLPADLDCKIISFHRFVIRLLREQRYELCNIGNMDETPMNFDMIGNQTVDVKGKKTILVKTTGHEKTRFTVVLACMADGTKLNPMVIFKRKTMPKMKFPVGVFVHVHEKGWMDEEGIKLWIDNVWNRRPGGLRKPRSLLVWDMFRPHLTDKTKKRLTRTNTDIAVIPGGLTSILQPLDVCLNKPFKDRIRTQWNEWMISGEKSFTKGGNMRAAPLDVLCNFVASAWHGIKVETVKKSFQKCGISNALDGTEDDMVYDDEDEEEAVDDVESDFDPYDDGIADVTDDVLEELLMSDVDDFTEFEGFNNNKD